MSHIGTVLLVLACGLPACITESAQVRPAAIESSRALERELRPRIGARIRVDAAGVFDVASDAGHIWVVTHSGREAFASELRSLDPTTGEIGKTTPLGSNAWNVVAMGGYVWVTDDEGLKKVDPRRRSVLETTPAPPGVEIATTRGAVWSATGMRFGADSGRLVTTVTGIRGNELASSRSSVWISNSNRGVVYEIDANRNVLVSDIEVSGQYADQLAYGKPALWVAWETDVARITLTKVDVARGEISDGASIVGKKQLIATDMIVAEGYVWLLAYGSRQSRLYQFDAATGERVGTFLQLEGTQLSITATKGVLWIGDLDSPVLTRIDLVDCVGSTCSG